MSLERAVAVHVASKVQARLNCLKTGNTEWAGRHAADLINIEHNHLPSGSGIDSGVRVDLDASTGERLVFLVPFHCMNEHGFYDGWRDYRVTVTPAFDGLHIRVTGRDYNGVKDYLADTMLEALTTVIRL